MKFRYSLNHASMSRVGGFKASDSRDSPPSEVVADERYSLVAPGLNVSLLWKHSEFSPRVPDPSLLAPERTTSLR